MSGSFVSPSILLINNPHGVTILKSHSQEVCANSAGCLESSKVSSQLAIAMARAYRNGLFQMDS